MNDALLFGISSVFYLLAMVCYLLFLIFKKRNIGKIASYVVYAGFVIHTTGFIYRWYIFSKFFSFTVFSINTYYKSV